MAKWEDLSYAFDDPTNDSFFMTSAPPASNRFKLQPSACRPIRRTSPSCVTMRREQ